MDVRLSPVQEALRESVSLVVDRLGPRTVRQLDDLERAEKLEAAVVASGWRDLRVPEGDGTPLASAVEAAIVAEELGHGLADAPFLGPTLAAELRRLASAPAATADETVVLAPSLSEFAVAVDGPQKGSLAIDAQGAESALVLVAREDDDGFVLASVPVPSVAVGVDLTRPSAVVGSASPLAVIDQGGRALSSDGLATCTALGLALTCADLVGIMRGAIELATGYASSRRQFGRPVGSFQAVQHLLADALVLMEGSRSVARHAAWAVDALDPEEALGAAARAKAYCARAARTVCETSIQVHGGVGNTWECLAHVYLRRALLSSEVLGGVGVNMRRVLAHYGIGATDGLR
jgi:alkylation response protein AidB-like acyl-CoA dehydrogenase